MTALSITTAELLPWRDRLGRFSPTRAAAFAVCVAPALWLGLRALWAGLGAQPLEVALHETGDWSIRLLLLSLAVTPLRVLWGWLAVTGVRRMLGLAGFAYALAHVLLHVAMENWRWWHVGVEITQRLYLAIGFAAALGLMALAASSFDAAIRRLGPQRWRALHRIVYVLMPLALAHFWMQVRLQDYIEPLAASGVFVWLMALRLVRPTAWRALGLGIVAVVLTALAEAAFLNAWFRAPPLSVLAGNLDAGLGWRPAWLVAVLVLPVALLPLIRDGAQAAARRA